MSKEIAPSGQDVLSLLQEVDWLQPLVSPAVLRMERQEIDDTVTRERSRIKLRKRCSCLEHGHCLCYRAHDDDQHIELSEEDVEVGVRNGRAIDCGVGSSPDRSSSSLEISPGYYCGVGLETVGRTVLHNAKTAALMAKLMIYKRMVYGHDRAFKKLIRKHLTPPRLGIGDHRLNATTYPRQIRRQASLGSGRFWDSSVIRRRNEDHSAKLIAHLGSAFNLCPGARWYDRDRTSTAITSSLYNAVIKSPLHTKLNEVASAFILQIAGYLSCPCRSRTYLLADLGYIVEQTCHRSSLRLAVALNSGYNRTSRHHIISSGPPKPQQTKLLTSTFLVWISYAASASLTFIMDMDTTYSLWHGISGLKIFFGNSTLHTHHIKQLNVVHSLIEPLLRLILTHPRPNVYLLWSGDKLIEVTLNLIAGSSDIESACSTVRNLDIISILPRLIPHCDTIRGSLNDKYLVSPLETLTLAAQSFLCVIATPFTGVSVLEDHGWPANSLAPSIPSDIS
ncbi:hypothetical protein BU17DRAFT_61771 [Hysterangium stoloniferum]|nr:hypothetical protein BU17DRAFT_61771 [Hysterangium stoloniferum]